MGYKYYHIAVKHGNKLRKNLDIYDSNTIINAKSTMVVFIAQKKIIKLQAIISDKSVILSFIEGMRKFEI